MKKYIKVYDNVLTQDQCNLIIQKFEQSSELHTRTVKPGHRYFTELNTTHSKDWQSMSMNIFLHIYVFFFLFVIVWHSNVNEYFYTYIYFFFFL